MVSALQPVAVVVGHRLAEDGDAEPADGEVGDGVRGAGLQRDLGLDALAAQARSNTVRSPVPAGMHTIG